MWKYVKGFEYRYEVSSEGEVRNYETEKLLKKRQTENGLRVNLVNRYGVRKLGTVHRLVAQCFVDNTCNDLYVLHKDKNRLNNHANNLKWVSKSDIKKHYNK